MGAQMDQCIKLSREGEVKGQIGVDRQFFGVVIDGLAIHAAAAVRLQGDQRLARAQGRKAECPANTGRIIARPAPSFQQGGARRIRQGGQPAFILRQRQSEGLCGPRAGEPGHQGLSIPCPGGIMAGLRQQIKDGTGACGCIQPHGETGPPAPRGIIGQDDGEAPFMGRRVAQAHPARGLPGQGGDAFPIGTCTRRVKARAGSSSSSSRKEMG